MGFELGFWDYLTFVTFALAGASVVAFGVWLAGLPGRIAIARNHPEAEAVKLLGWAGLLPTIYPWVQAFIWAYKPTDVVDIRRFPREEERATEEEIARLRGAPRKPAPQTNEGPNAKPSASQKAAEAASPPAADRKD
jgi:hypothetical protein